MHNVIPNEVRNLLFRHIFKSRFLASALRAPLGMTAVPGKLNYLVIFGIIGTWYNAIGDRQMDYNEYIVRDAEVCGGEPVIEGTRVTLRTVTARQRITSDRKASEFANRDCLGRMIHEYNDQAVKTAGNNYTKSR